MTRQVAFKSCEFKLPYGCRFHPMFHCDLLSKAYNPTPLRQHCAKFESDLYEKAIDYVSEITIDTWPSRRGLYHHVLTHFGDMTFMSRCYCKK